MCCGHFEYFQSADMVGRWNVNDLVKSARPNKGGIQKFGSISGADHNHVVIQTVLWNGQESYLLVLSRDDKFLRDEKFEHFS